MMITGLAGLVLATVRVTGLGSVLSRVPYPGLAGTRRGLRGRVAVVRAHAAPPLAAVPLVLVAVAAGTALHYLIAALAGPGVVGSVLRSLPGMDAARAD